MPHIQARARFHAALTLAARYDDGPVLGLPASAMVLTNSERKELQCPRRWWYSRGAGLASPPNLAMRFGSAFDAAMERMLRFYAAHDGQRYTQAGLQVCPGCGGAGCSCCDGTGLGAFTQVREELWQQGLGAEQDHEELSDMVLRLERALEGWLYLYDDSMAQDYRVLSAQLQLAAPVTNLRGQVYRSKVPVLATGEGWRLATAHDSPDDVQLVLLPWFQLCKLDGLVQERRSGKLRAWETKTSGNPERFSRDLLLDTQLPGYTRALWYVTQALGAFGGAEPVGWVWDVTSSQLQADPRVLKDGTISLASGQLVPSWRWQPLCRPVSAKLGTDRGAGALQALQAAVGALQARHAEAAETARQMGRGKAGAAARAARDQLAAQLKDSQCQLQTLEHERALLAMPASAAAAVDSKLYVRRWGEHTPARLAEYEAELFADAQQIASWLRALPGTADQPTGCPADAAAFAMRWPRHPVCRGAGGWCSFTGICLEDSAQGRADYELRQPLRWLTSAAAAARNTEGR